LLISLIQITDISNSNKQFELLISAIRITDISISRQLLISAIGIADISNCAHALPANFYRSPESKT